MYWEVFLKEWLPISLRRGGEGREHLASRVDAFVARLFEDGPRLGGVLRLAEPFSDTYAMHSAGRHIAVVACVARERAPFGLILFDAFALEIGPSERVAALSLSRIACA